MTELPPAFPAVTATVRPDASAEVVFNGVSHVLTAETIPGAREAVSAYVAYRAGETLGRAVRATVTDPEGRFDLVIHPDGSITEQHTTPAHEPALGPPAAAAPAPPAEPPPFAPEAPVTAGFAAPHAFSATAVVTPSAPVAPPSRRELRASFLTTEQVEAPAATGLRGFLTRVGVRTSPSAAERAYRADVEAVSQHWPGVRTIAVVNGKGGANKTPTTALLSAVFARNSGAATLAWDNNETRGTLGWRTDQGSHTATILDLLPQAGRLLAPGAKAGDISHYVHHQPADKYDVLRSNPNLISADQRISAEDVDAVHDVAGRYYRLVFVDSGNDESAGHWLRMINKADQLVVATVAQNEHAEAGALLLEELYQRGGRAAQLAQSAVVVVSQAREKDTNPTAGQIAKGFGEWVREVVTIPYDRAMVESALHFDALQPATRRAWLRAGAAVAGGL
ncbi:ATPase [Occultella glacieicola]|uniref:ATPase n=1 Tax=Occultella glacieicola TaxID=2518684 RepID=A0ABY2DXK2_9MICO|nr:AAA family ATPase [Occultella glacieicola]TDE88156.1 ATPase [Occultella glacieicola]